jgi:hypothetical protein
VRGREEVQSTHVMLYVDEQLLFCGFVTARWYVIGHECPACTEVERDRREPTLSSFQASDGLQTLKLHCSELPPFLHPKTSRKNKYH